MICVISNSFKSLIVLEGLLSNMKTVTFVELEFSESDSSDSSLLFIMEVRLIECVPRPPISYGWTYHLVTTCSS
uniref:Uncharacterized protein n=1 Tax=Megaselia scalaris TaxID=36166 RepID=T1GBL9_MEGSC